MSRALTAYAQQLGIGRIYQGWDWKEDEREVYCFFLACRDMFGAQNARSPQTCLLALIICRKSEMILLILDSRLESIEGKVDSHPNLSSFPYTYSVPS